MLLLARRLLLVALVAGLAVELLLRGHAPGINLVLVVALVLGGAWLTRTLAIRGGHRQPGVVDPADWWLAPAAIGFAALVAVRADRGLVVADTLGAVTLAGAAIASFGGVRVTRGSLRAAAGGAGWLAAGATIGGGAVLLAAEPTRVGVRPPSGSGAAVRGLLLAVPAVAVFVGLFAAADAVFARALDDALALQLPIDLGGLPTSAVVVLVAAWSVAGLLGLASAVPGLSIAIRATASPLWSPAPERAAAEALPAPRPRRPAIGPTEALVALVVLDALFALFVALQVTWLFGGRDTLAATGLTYAEYARRGFFELVAVAALVVALVSALAAAVSAGRPTGRFPRSLAAAGITLLALTGVVLLSAFERMRLYQAAYGWTELRFQVLCGISFLALALLATGALVARDRVHRVPVALAALALVVLAGANAVGPDAFVAARNLERALDPSLVPPDGRTGLDGAYLATLGDGAVPTIVAALPAVAESERRQLIVALAARRRALEDDPMLTGWPAWNLDRELARAALARAIGP